MGKLKSNHDSKRIIGLDIIRALAISIIVLFHATPLLWPLKIHGLFGKVILIYLKTMTWIGPISVDLFFVLSGFLIGSILIRVFINTDQFTLPVIWEFWIKRWFRTLPNYLFLLTTGFILYFILYHETFDWRYYFFVQNLTQQMPKFFGETWSLSIEEWTYLLLPIAILLMATLLKKSEKKEILKFTIIAYIFIAVSVRFFKVYQQNYIDVDEQIRKVTIYRMDGILYGVLIAYCMQYYQLTLYKHRKKLLYGGVVGVLLTLFLSFVILHLPHLYLNGSALKIGIDTLFYTLIPFFFSLIIPAAYFFKDMRSILIKRLVTHISVISYSLYLIHNTLLFIPFFKPLSPSNSSMLLISAYLGFIVISILLSTVNYYYFERPTTGLRDVYIRQRDKQMLNIKNKG